MAKQKRIMREFALDEISVVTRPAQKGAQMVIMKREGGPDGKPKATPAEKRAAEDARIAGIVKRGKFRLTTPVNGHTHIIELDEWAEMCGGGYTEWTGDYETPGRHRHPFIVGPKGEITIGEEMGHSHELADVPSKKAADSPLPDPATVEKESDMTESEVKKLQALAAMSDAQKAHFGKLSGAEADAFIEADSAGRDAIVAKAEAAAKGDNPVLYTTKAGIAIRKSDGETAMALAKQMDEMADGFKAAQDTATTAKAEALANRWTHIGKPLAEKIEMAKGILAIPDEKTRQAAIDGIEAGVGKVASLFKSFGAMGADSGEAVDDPEAELEKLANERVSKSTTGETFEQAYAKMLETPKGAALYQQLMDAKRARDGQPGFGHALY